MKTVEVQYGDTAHVVKLYPLECLRDCLGIPSSVSAVVIAGTRSNDDTAEFTPAVTVDAVSTTVDADSGWNQTNRKKVSLAATTGIAIGSFYLLTNALGQSEAVEVKKITSADSVEVMSALQYLYPATTSTFKGIACTFTVDPTWAATESKLSQVGQPDYRIRWTYTVAGVVRGFQSYLRLVRKPFRSSLTFSDIASRWPDLLLSEPSDYRGEKFRRMIEEAEAQLRSDIIGEGYAPEQFSDTETIDRLVNHALDYQIARFHKAPNDRDRELFIQECKLEYGTLFAKVLSALKLAVTTTSSGATDPAPLQRFIWGR